MNALAHEIAECSIDHPLPLDAGFAGERLALDRQAEMAFAGRVVAAVPAMLLTVIGKIDAAG